jgi:arylsulfatase A-like enzyme/Tfp pilus assembly protein PilF
MRPSAALNFAVLDADSTIRLVIRMSPAILLAIGLAAYPGAVQPARPDVLLVTIDTLRADRLGSHGYKAARTPVLDRLAAEGVRFADATTHAPLTYPAHVAILTGRYPSGFDVRLNGMNPLPASVNTLPERMKAAGYETAAVIGSAILDAATGLDQGFDHYEDRIAAAPSTTVAMSDLQRSAREVTDLAAGWLQGRNGRPEGRRSWFLWVHYYDPHLPYEPPAVHATRSPGRPYDGEVAYVDAQVGRLLAALDRARTLVVVTSDHGEALGEHGEPDHGLFLYDSTLHVPLIIRGPSGTGGTPFAARVVTEQVRSIDIAPTIAEIASLPPDPDSDGMSLVPLLHGKSRTDVPVSIAESWYPRLHFGWSELRSARVGEWKYIAAPKPELYDLRVDRAEARNLVHDRAAVAARLAAEIASASSPPKSDAPAAQPDPETIRRLQALGYVGAFAPVTSGRAGDNPLDRVADYRRYREQFSSALTLLESGNASAAAAMLQRLVKANVRAFEAHLYLGNAYAAQGRIEAALAEYDVAAMLNPSLATPDYEAAKLLSQKGEHDKAVERCRRGLARDPGSFYGHYTLGVIHQAAGQWASALEAFSRAVDLNDRDPRAHTNAAAAALRSGDPDRAAKHFERMIALGYQQAPAHFNLGVLAARKGDTAEAARRYRLALAADPGFKPAIDALKKIR